MNLKHNHNFSIRQLSDSEECPEDEFRFRAIITSKNLDSYYSHMNDESLDNFANKINTKGVSLLDGHQTDGLDKIIGRWTEAKRDGDQVIATATMLRSTDKTPDHLNIDEYIRRVEKGFYTDVSVGFYGHRSICDLCDGDIEDWTSKNRCKHWPGKKYEIDGAERVCTYQIRDAQLGEASLVFDAANEDCQILSVRNAPKELINWKQSKDNDENLSELELIGRKYKRDLIDQLVVEGVRALGSDFNEDKERLRYEKWSIDDIQDQIKTYEKFTNLTGGRKIKSNETHQRSSNNLPDWVFG